MEHGKKKSGEPAPKKIWGDPEYGPEEDIYSQEEKLELNDEGNIVDPDEPRQEGGAEDLDIPGSELDDADENIGEEDEENNYYSLGGDNHDDLEEDNS
jgi:hypothetical protein